MGTLFMMDFPADRVRIESRYQDHGALERIRTHSPDGPTLPKIRDVYGELLFPPAPADRPYTVCSVVLSADGKMAFADRTAGPLIARQNHRDPDGALADFWMLNALRACADGVILGARTLQSEADNTSHIFDPEMLQQRREQGIRPPHPLNIVVSFDATDIPLGHRIFSVDPQESFRVAVATSPEGARYLAEQTAWPSRLLVAEEILAGGGPEEEPRLRRELEAGGRFPVFVSGSGRSPDARALLALLRMLGMERLLIESPSYNWHLLEHGMLDEFYINYSLLYAGGGVTPGVSAPFPHDRHPHARLLTLGTHASSFLFTRQQILYDVEPREDLDRYRY